jgi:hypothetical protein
MRQITQSNSKNETMKQIRSGSRETGRECEAEKRRTTQWKPTPPRQKCLTNSFVSGENGIITQALVCFERRAALKTALGWKFGIRSPAAMPAVCINVHSWPARFFRSFARSLAWYTIFSYSTCAFLCAKIAFRGAPGKAPSIWRNPYRRLERATNSIGRRTHTHCDARYTHTHTSGVRRKQTPTCGSSLIYVIGKKLLDKRPPRPRGRKATGSGKLWRAGILPSIELWSRSQSTFASSYPPLQHLVL